jgi:hypothetical protein
MQYDTGKHCVFYHRYHIVWSTGIAKLLGQLVLHWRRLDHATISAV